MSVWVCVPSARPVEHVRQWAAVWRERGYKVALWRDPGAEVPENAAAFISEAYPGYALATNGLVKLVLELDCRCNWVVCGGDDVYPDPNHTAGEITEECSRHFFAAPIERVTVQCENPMPDHLQVSERIRKASLDSVTKCSWSTFGVMQPTGDRYGEDSTGSAYADRVCGSAWLGREFCLRINQGKGPLWHEYTAMFVDEELQNVALKYGVLWQRRDLVHRHEHWARARGDRADMPEFLKSVNTPEHWRKYKALFEKRRAAGFPGSEPL